MPLDPSILHVYSAGPVTVLGFGGQKILDQVDLAACRNQIVDLVKQHQTQTLAFDLTGVRLIPSGMLGMLVSLKQLGVAIQLFNPSEDVREVLSVTRLDTQFQIESLPDAIATDEPAGAKTTPAE
jgi:anti-sigma B factor antagonist